MRTPLACVVLAVALTACHSSDTATTCPTPDDTGSIDGMACFGTGTCFAEDDFSGCASAFYRCERGEYVFDHRLDATDGASCAGSPLASCSYEGNDCSAEPTGQACDCGSDGLWHCECRCYDPTRGDCPSCPATYFDGLAQPGIQCGPAGNVCSYPGHTCTCGSDEQFHCD